MADDAWRQPGVALLARDRTMWVEGARQRCTESKATPQPGTDYIVREPGPVDSYFIFPEIPGDMSLRHQWVLEMCRVPVVPVFSHSPLPSWRQSRQRRAELLSVYYRPWLRAP